jgi:tryptophan synthase alpha chain
MADKRIAKAFDRARRENRAAFVPYITAGDPSLERTSRYLDVLAEAGADIVELGIPFSDPIADGPVNQRSSERALAAGTTLAGALDLIAEKRKEGFDVPVVVFSYFNPICRMGVDRFVGRAARSGVDGVLVVDLPPEEAGEYRESLAAGGIDSIFLASPTTDEERLAAVGEASTGFVYYVSRLGVTGTRSALAEGLEEDLLKARRTISKPMAVGFGISTPEQAAAVARFADGVIVGSALVKLLEEKDASAAETALKNAASAIAGALKRES